jgi:RNA polymerase sigma factor (sigma-70 family)
VFLSTLPAIERAIGAAARRHRLTPEEKEDFASEVKVALIEDDYAVLARFQGRSSLPTYLMTVIQRLVLDYQRKRWGKWRPSAEALRLGPVAQQLERLIHRDGLSASEACESLKTNHGVEEASQTLMEMASRLPARVSRRTETIDHTTDGSAPIVPAATEASNPHVVLEVSDGVRRCQEAIWRALEAMPADDRVLLRLHFEDEVSIADIARIRKVDQKRLYRKMQALLGSLREVLEGAGLTWTEVTQLIDRGQCELGLAPSEELLAKSPAASPSHQEARS